MTLSTGTKLAHYEISSQLGKGGMGEVYQAKDRKLGRDVAIKVLPEEFAKDADRVARFQREAKLLASLNHPNIAAIHGLEESDGTHFLVLELIEGDTLADRLKRGAIPVEESLKLALQIAEALDAAHEKGVIHRDLKPANIKVTPNGKVKVLDFGLAKAFAGEQGEMILSDSPTLSVAATQQGIILGTAAYMSPEQAKGKTVDKKTDIWAFGAVLYEMLTGKPAFKDDEVSEILASVIKGDTNLDLLPAKIHPRIRELLFRCLQKEQKRRYSGISDVQYEIEQVLADPSGVFVKPVTAAKPRKKLRVGIPWVAAAIFLSLIIAGVAGWYFKPFPKGKVMRFDYHLPEDQQFKTSITHPSHIAISPNGSYFLYATTEGLYIRPMDQMEARLIPGTDENSRRAFFSPDGQWVVYFSGADNKLKKANINGGVPVSLCDAPGIHDGTWHMDNTIVYGASGQGIMRVSSDGGIPETLVEFKDGTSGNYNRPQLLPDGKSLLFSHWQPDVTRILVHSLETGESKDLIQGLHAKYLQTGHIVYRLNDVIYAAPFDLDTLEITGGSVSMVEGVQLHDISDEGTLIYLTRSVRPTAGLTLFWVDREGKEEPLDANPDNYQYVRISPDGTKVALTIDATETSEGTTETSDIWILDLIRGNRMRLTRNGNSSGALWHPDGQRIFFASGNEDRRGIYWRKADGTGNDEFLGSRSGRSVFPSSWSSGGKSLITSDGIGNLLLRVSGQGDNWAELFREVGFRLMQRKIPLPAKGASRRDSFRADIGLLSLEGDHEWEALLQQEYPEFAPQISPDGHWIAYVSTETGQQEVYVRPFPDVNAGKWQISIDGGNNPLWSPDGKELFYRWGDSVMVVAVETKPTFKAGKPELLFPDQYDASWDINPDGKRFLMLKRVGVTGDESTSDLPGKINIVLNWFEELKERVPVE